MLYQYRYDWMDQFWAANILLATLTDGGTFHSQAQSFLKFWICGTDEVPIHACLLIRVSMENCLCIAVICIWVCNRVLSNVTARLLREVLLQVLLCLCIQQAL